MYEDYFKSVIGGNFSSPEYYAPTYENKNYEAIQVNSLPGYNYSSSDKKEVEELYPDIYNVISPMIDKIVSNNNIDIIDKNKLDSLTIEIYEALEADDAVNVSSNLNYDINNNLNNNSNNNSNNNLNNNLNNNINNSLNKNVNKNLNQSNMINSNSIIKTSNNIASNSIKDNSNIVNTNSNGLKIENNKTLDVSARCRNCKNPLLRDLIKILILNRINNNRPQYRPPYVSRPIPNYRDVSTEIFKPYTNYSKTYFDMPYPEED